MRWQCMVCGYVESGVRPPDECPVCGAPFTAFQRVAPEAAPPRAVEDRPDGYRYVIVGNSSAGRSAARAIRQVHPNGQITLISEEPVPLYYRPLLPDYIGGAAEEVLFRAGRRMQADEGVELLLGETAEAIDPVGRVVRCRSGREVAYDSLLVATGSAPVVVSWPGSDAAGIAYFRTFADAQAIAGLATGARRAVVVGGGLLGLEFVRAFLARHLEVTLLVRGDRVGAPGLDPEAGGIVARRLRELGVGVGLEEEVVAFESDGGRVVGVHTSRGRLLPCDVVGVAVGVRPRIELAQGAGLACDRGILVDGRFATSVPGVFAAGDVAQVYDLAHGERRLVTSWRAAHEMGRIAGWNMAGADVRCEGLVGANFQVFGGIPFVSIGQTNPPAGSAVVEQELDEEAGKYVKRVYREGRLVGAVLVGDTQSAHDLEQAIRGAAAEAPAASKGPAQHASLGVAPTQRKETKTMRKMSEENLKAALAGESQAHLKYLNFSQKAQQEGKENVARLFAAASYSEQVHASAHLRTLKGIGSTEENLAAAIEGEGFEVDEMYPAYMAVAEQQEERAARSSFYKALEAEKVHRELYAAALEAVRAGGDVQIGTIYVCSVCGFTMSGEAPDECPVCGAAREKFREF